MSFKVVHILSNLQRINFGIWNAAIFGAKRLMETKGIQTLVLVCTARHDIPAEINVPVVFWEDGNGSVANLLASKGFTANETIVVTHGVWLAPSRLGYKLKKAGYRWIYTPHGMLEPWSLNNQRFKKLVYWNLMERRMVQRADIIRAVSKREKKNLEVKLGRNIVVIENGVVVPPTSPKTAPVTIYLFLARLHYKKGIRPLVDAWHAVNEDNKTVKLIIAGPDEGELQLIQPLLHDNIEYVGPVYGDSKKELLADASYYILPSYSEGFPTSVLEAMSYGQIPLISNGCNFPEVFEQNLGYHVEPNVESISRVLIDLRSRPFDVTLSARNREFVTAHYSEDKIAGDLHKMYSMIAAG